MRWASDSLSLVKNMRMAGPAATTAPNYRSIAVQCEKWADCARKCGKRGRKSQMNPPTLLQSRLQERFIGYDVGLLFCGFRWL
jgi:hypothetical protein